MKQEQVKIVYDKDTVTLKAEIDFPVDSSHYEKNWKLFAPINGEPVVTMSAYKIEITMKKCSGVQWDALERKVAEAIPTVDGSIPPEIAAAASIPVVQKRENVVRTDVNATAYPSSNKTLKNWEELEKEAKKAEDEEKPEGEAALQKLFQSIYGGSDEDTKRAMIKSFQTSGGTVLSTNWKEVARKDYSRDRSAPPGQEMKDWNSPDR